MITNTSTRWKLATTIAVAALMLAGCSSPAPSSAPTVEAIETEKPTPTPTPTPTVEAEPGTRANPLQPGEKLKLSERSMWTVGANGPTEVHDGYIVLPLHVDFDWETGRAQGLDPENEGADPSYSLIVSYVSASGRSFTTMDNYDVPNQWYELGVVYPPATSIDAGVPISVPADQVAGGVWKIENMAGGEVFIVGG